MNKKQNVYMGSVSFLDLHLFFKIMKWQLEKCVVSLKRVMCVIVYVLCRVDFICSHCAIY